jgi:sortase A
MKKLIAFIIIVFLAMGGFFVGMNLKQSDMSQIASQKQNLPTNTVVQGQKTSVSTSFVPKRLRIAKIGVDASAESVGLDAKGNMDVPKGVQNVAWYNLGFKPGEKGSAVIAGHLDTPQGKPAVFYNISKLTKGDTIKVSDEKGNELTYVVTDKKNYPYDNFPLEEVFNSTDKARLNLITCGGAWDKAKGTYLKRTVVFSELQI